MNDLKAQKLATRKQDRKLRAKLCMLDHPILTQACFPVLPSDFGTPGLTAVITMLLDGCKAFDAAVGLAAPQMGSRHCIIAIWPDRNLTSFSQPRVLINPEITKHSETTSVRSEGCLSYPGTFKQIVRHDWVVVRFLDAQGAEHTERFEDYAARVVQHEVDHLSGRCQIHTGSILSVDGPSPCPRSTLYSSRAAAALATAAILGLTY